MVEDFVIAGSAVLGMVEDFVIAGSAVLGMVVGHSKFCCLGYGCRS